MTDCATKSSAGNGHDSSLDASEEEDAEDSSSSYDGMNDVEDTLASFREKWQKELQLSTKQTIDHNADKIVSTSEQNSDEDVENTAKRLFLKGSEMERSGKLYEAIQFYRRAVQLVPDIEFRLDNVNKNNIKDQKSQKDVSIGKKGINDRSKGDLKGKNLLLRIQKKLNNYHSFCIPEFEQKAAHISVLPVEILLYVFRWVVSSDLDMRSLEMCSMVCRGFYIHARDSEIWRSACIRMWGLNCGNLPDTFSSWRHMFLERAKLHFHGCYISKTTYIRHGENSFQDQFYRPWHLVAYYRYLRFFPEGTVLMLTTAEEPIQCVGQLKSKNARSPSVLVGQYRLKDDKVTLVVQRQDNSKSNQMYKRSKRRDNMRENAEQTFHLELQIENHNKRKHNQLIWTRYAVYTRNFKGEETTCSFDLVTNRFPPLWFSRVKSYTSESESPLQ